MQNQVPISVTVITFNEEKNISAAIRSVQWAQEILVIDSGSTDQTRSLAESLGAKVLYNPWKGYGQQKNFAQTQARHDWILSLDADEVVPHELADEIQETLQKNGKSVFGYTLPRKTFYLGRWISHGGWYPNPVMRLTFRPYSKWTEPHVHEVLEVEGPTRSLQQPLHHYSFKNIESQVLTNLRFSSLGARDLKKRGVKPSLSRILLKPVGKFLETYIIKRGFMDGIPGLFISINAAHSMFLKQAYLWEENLHENSHY